MTAFHLLLALGLAQAAAPHATTSQQGSEVTQADVQAIIANCTGRKFEAPFEFEVDGKVRKSKLKLCGKPGQTDAEWARTLQDAIRKIEANDKMPAAVKAQVVPAINAELAKLSITAAPPASVLASPLPVAPPAPPPAPLATPATPATTVATITPRPRPVAASLPPMTKPRLSFRCFTPGEIGAGGPCTTLQRETLLIVRADENLPGGTSLRFLRKGEIRSELALADMPRGKSVRLKLPQRLCAGVVGSNVEIQVTRRHPGAAGSNQVVDTLGPYDLRC